MAGTNDIPASPDACRLRTLPLWAVCGGLRVMVGVLAETGLGKEDAALIADTLKSPLCKLTWLRLDGTVCAHGGEGRAGRPMGEGVGYRLGRWAGDG